MEEEKTYNFGSVITGTKKILNIEIVNNSTICQTYKIVQFSTMLHQCSSGFTMSPEESPGIHPSKTYIFKLSFEPTFPETNYCDYFTVHHLFGIQLKVCALGKTKSDGCTLSRNALILTCPLSNSKITKFIEFQNANTSSAIFLFDLDQTQCPLIIDPWFGEVPQLSNTRIKVTFQPMVEGVYFKRIFCLRLYQEPLILDVTCVYANSCSHLNELTQFLKDLPQYKNSYDLYMSDVSTVLQEDKKPLASLNVNYLNMGPVSPSSSDLRMLPFTLTNNNNTALCFKWSKDTTGVFKVNPECSTVQPGATKQFNVSFRPHRQELLFSTVFDCMLKLEGHKYYIVAFPLSLCVFGHSFLADSAGWPAMCEVFPKTAVHFPPCIPPKPAYTTLLIRRFGCLPLSFRFIAPNVTNYAVKPKQGVITGCVQIIVVQFLPRVIEEGYYTEKWILKFNTNEQQHKHPILFIGSVEKLKLIVNEGEPVIFPNTHPGCHTPLLVPIRNPTRHTINYSLEVLVGEDILDVQQYGEVYPNQTVFSVWTFLPRGEGNFVTEVKCNIIKPCHILTEDTLTSVQAESVNVEIERDPYEIVIETIKGIYVESSFKLVNTGVTTAYIALSCGDYTKAILQPTNFTLEPGKNIQVCLNATSDLFGYSSFQILCSLRVCSESNILLDGSTGSIIVVHVETVYPILQVTDLHSVNQGHNFSKLNFWNMFNIEKLNCYLRNVSSDTVETVTMKCPSLLSNITINVEILVKNQSNTPLQWNIKQCKSCNCEPVLTQVSFSISKMINFCQHKDQITFQPCSGTLKAQEEEILLLKVHYSVDSCPPIDFILSLWPEDHNSLKHSVKLCINRFNINCSEEFIDYYESTYLTDSYESCCWFMVPIPIDCIQPFIQAFWLYNNTNKQVSYKVDTSHLKGTVFNYIKGPEYVEPQSSVPLLFTFFPYAEEIYEGLTNITLGTRNISLFIFGFGINSDEMFVIREKTKMPSVSGLLSLRLPDVYTSKSHIEMNCLQIHGQQRYIFLLNNASSQSFYFKWEKVVIENILVVKVSPYKGNLPPHSHVLCQLVCISLGMPCCITLNMCCQLFNITAHKIFLKQTQIQEEKLQQCKEWFTITEKGTTYPDYNCFKTTEKPKTPDPVLVSVGITVLLPVSDQKHQAQTPLFAKYFFDDAKPNPVLKVKASTTTDILSKIVWNVLNEMLTSGVFEIPCTTYYSQIKPLDKKCTIEEIINSLPFVPKKVIQNVISDLIFTNIIVLFNLTSRKSRKSIDSVYVHELMSSSKRKDMNINMIGSLDVTESLERFVKKISLPNLNK